MSIDIHCDGSYTLSFHRKSFKKARHRKKADRLVRAFCKVSPEWSALAIDAQWFKVKDMWTGA